MAVWQTLIEPGLETNIAVPAKNGLKHLKYTLTAGGKGIYLEYSLNLFLWRNISERNCPEFIDLIIFSLWPDYISRRVHQVRF